MPLKKEAGYVNYPELEKAASHARTIHSNERCLGATTLRLLRSLGRRVGRTRSGNGECDDLVVVRSFLGATGHGGWCQEI
jgi:hypothetical protein